MAKVPKESGVEGLSAAALGKPRELLAAILALPEDAARDEEVARILADVMLGRGGGARGDDARMFASIRLRGQCSSSALVARMIEEVDRGLARWSEAAARTVSHAAQVLATSPSRDAVDAIVARVERALDGPLASPAQQEQADILLYALKDARDQRVLARAAELFDARAAAARESASERVDDLGLTAADVLIAGGGEEGLRRVAGHLGSAHHALAMKAMHAALLLPDEAAITLLAAGLERRGRPGALHWTFEWDSDASLRERRHALYASPRWLDIARPLLARAPADDAQAGLEERVAFILGFVADERATAMLEDLGRRATKTGVLSRVAEALGRRKARRAAPLLLDILRRSGGAAFSAVSTALEEMADSSVVAVVKKAADAAKGSMERQQLAMLHDTVSAKLS